MKNIALSLTLTLVLISFTAAGPPADKLTDHVDPYIGSGGHGHVFVGANVPFGFVQLGPSQLTQGWDWCSGYHYSDSTIVGFGHLHLSGTGIGDLGDISFMPVAGPVVKSRGQLPDPESGIYSFFSHDNETVRPGYYSVILDRFGIEVELTATERTGFHRYTYPDGARKALVMDMTHGIGWDTPVEGHIEQVGPTAVRGYRKSRGWAADQRVYFYAEFSAPITGFSVFEGPEPREGNSLTARFVYGEAEFDLDGSRQLMVKVGVSPVSMENARENLLVENPGWDFEGVTLAANDLWERELSKIRVKGDDLRAKRIFYTGMYHTMTAPSVFHDHNGDYISSDLEVRNSKEFTNHTTFSLWDTYRAASPLMTILHPDRCRDIASTFIDIYNGQGKLPVWHLMGNETNCMVGNSGVIVASDLLLKGLVRDTAAMTEAIYGSLMLAERGMGLREGYGYIPWDLDPEHETVAKGLEYAIADWGGYKVAEVAGDDRQKELFGSRARAYRRYFDPQTQFMRAVGTDGRFREPFDPFSSTHREDDYTEGNAWQYTWLVPHDVTGLVDLFGSERAFVNKLDSLFVVEGFLGEEASPDISGLIGQYAHGNEPSHQAIYLYPFVGQQWKTAARVREVLETMYDDQPDGLCGNEDVGQMSAWYILSSLGLYQVDPCAGPFIIGSPLFEEVVVDTGNGRTFTVRAVNNNPQNVFIQSATLYGEPYPLTYITYETIVGGGVLELVMGPAPNEGYGSLPMHRPAGANK